MYFGLRVILIVMFFFFKQKTSYEMRISDWSSDVCSADLRKLRRTAAARGFNEAVTWSFLPVPDAGHFSDGAKLWLLENPISDDMRAMRLSPIGRASCRARVCPYR